MVGIFIAKAESLEATVANCLYQEIRVLQHLNRFGACEQLGLSHVTMSGVLRSMELWN